MKRISFSTIYKKLLWGMALLLLSNCIACSSPAAPQEQVSVTLPPFQVVCLDVGKADAFLLLSDNGCVVMDTGEKNDGKELVQTLENLGVSHIDYLILSHFDKDHAGGAAKLLRSFPVDTVLQTYPSKENNAYENYLEALQKTGLSPQTVTSVYEFTLDGVSYRVLPPAKSSYIEDTSNNSSLVVQADYGNHSFLFTGDAEEERLLELLKDSSLSLSCTFLKVPYHGHYQDILPAFLKKASPSYAVITSSIEEPEDTAVLTLLQKQNCKTYLTRKGTITFTSDGSTITTS